MDHRGETASGRSEGAERRSLSILRARMLVLLVAASILPLTALGVGAWVAFERIIETRAEAHLRTIVRDHAETVDLFLDERLMALSFVARAHSKQELSDPAYLKRIFDDLDATYGNSFLDLGVIDDTGAHLAYVGPYSLLDKNYREAAWFARVVERGEYVSDVFLGFRNEPHFVIAVRRDDARGGFWILRASINPVVFDNLVARGQGGRTGECFILDGAGRFQTSARDGRALLTDSGIRVPPPTADVITERVQNGASGDVFRTFKWIKDRTWVLVAQKDAKEVLAPVRAAMRTGALVFMAGALTFIVAALLVTRTLIQMIERSNAERDRVRRQLEQTRRLASIGEMAVGLAHEINNPLAIIYTEQVNILDALGSSGRDDEDMREVREAVDVSKRQIDRCKSITQRMLQFGRAGVSDARQIDVPSQIRELGRLIAPQARQQRVELCVEVDPGLPPIVIDPTELQQVVNNLLANAIHAAGIGGGVLLSVWQEGGLVHLTVEDTGPGIARNAIGRVFEPFFTTKAIGEGTGLGLSVCYGIVTKWRGRIGARNARGGGAIFHVQFPAVVESGETTWSAEGRTHERQTNSDHRAVGG